MSKPAYRYFTLFAVVLMSVLPVQFRGEFFNFTNTASFNNPVTNIQAANAGHITSAGAPRDIQLALKLLF